MRQNIIEDVWADIFDVAQSTISRYITFLTPIVEKATEENRPAAEDAAEATRNAIALVDGTLWPCWSWDGESKLWSGKYKTTGHGSLIVTNLQGRITFVSEPVTGNQHDIAKLKGSDAEKILKKAGGVFGDKGFIGTDYITTPIRKPECRELLRWEHEWNNQVSSLRNTLNLRSHRCKMPACREQDSRPGRTRAAWRTGSPSGCWPGRSRGSLWMR